MTDDQETYTPRYEKPSDVPHPTAKERGDYLAERHKREGMLDLNGGLALGPNPRLRRGDDPNNLWDRKTNRFIPNTSSRGSPKSTG